MALKIQQLNGDTTFLLTFSPPFAPDNPSKRFPGDFTILIDPWLIGHSSILHPAFQISHHVSKPEIATLADLKQDVDVIIISQDKPDHCHRETLCSLPADSKAKIVAIPTAAKTIQSWKHFEPSRLLVLKAYHPKDDSSVFRIPLPAYCSGNAAGEITIANMPTKYDMTGLHNAIGITYQPPCATFSMNTQFSRYDEGTTAQLGETGISRPTTGAQRAQTPRVSVTKALRKSVSYPYLPQTQPETVPTKPRRRADSGIASQPSSPTSKNNEDVISLIYTPHGVSPSTISPYLTHHLHSIPITALLHCMNSEQNPLFLGGRVAVGAPGGVDIAKVTSAKWWVSAHDEEKDNRGLATAWIKSRRYGVGEVEGMLKEEGMGGTRVRRLGVGECLRVEAKEEKEALQVVRKSRTHDGSYGGDARSGRRERRLGEFQLNVF